MMVRELLMGLCLYALVGCGASAPNQSTTMPDIKPQDFVLLPCGLQGSDRPCALVVAGGKRVLFGAPAGVTATLGQSDLRQLDAVMLFSLRAADLEGLDEVRNASWRAGRDEPLLVIGPRGMAAVVTALNKAYEQADALRIVEEGIPPGGYDAAVLEALEATSAATVFNTGDVIVERLRDGYRIDYIGAGIAYLQTCKAESAKQVEAELDVKVIRVACDSADGDLVWPLSTPVFVVKN